MNQDKNDYVSIIYNEKRTPKTDYPKQLIKYLSKRFDLQGNMKILELGCGRGDFLLEFQKFGFECKGLDRDESSVKNEYGLEVKRCDLASDVFPYDDESFDLDATPDHFNTFWFGRKTSGYSRNTNWALLGPAL